MKKGTIHKWNQLKTLVVIASLAAGTAAFTAGCASDHGVQETAGEGINDNLITSHVSAALQSASEDKFTDVQVNTFKGTVQLSGFVASGSAKDQALNLAKRVDGVKDVVNNITVK